MVTKRDPFLNNRVITSDRESLGRLLHRRELLQSAIWQVKQPCAPIIFWKEDQPKVRKGFHHLSSMVYFAHALSHMRDCPHPQF
jgi:hypothetical protein